MSSKPSKPTVTTSTSTSTPAVPPEMGGLAEQLRLIGEKFAGREPPAFPKVDRFIEPLTGEETGLLAEAKGALRAPRPSEELSKQYFTDVAGGKYLDPNAGPLKQQVEALKTDTLEAAKRITGDILGRTGAAGAGRGSREALMLGQAAGETSRGLARSVADLIGEQYQKERLLQQAAAGELPGFEDKDYQRVLAELGLAGIPREITQAERSAQIGQQEAEYQAGFAPIQMAQAILGQRLGQTIPIIAPGANPLTGIASLLTGGGNLINSLRGSGTTTSRTTSGGGGGFSGLGGLVGLFKDFFSGSSD